MVKLDLRWLNNLDYVIIEEGKPLEPKKDAPEDVKESYANYRKQQEYYLKREQEEGSKLI